MKKLSGIHYGQKHKQRGQSDLVLLIDIQNYIKRRWHLGFKREWYVGFNKETGGVECILEHVDKSIVGKYKWRNPDLSCFTKNNGFVIIEVDGKIHDRRVAKTKARNEDYKRAGIKFIVLSLSDIKERKKTIKGDLDWKMTKLGL